MIFFVAENIRLEMNYPGIGELHIFLAFLDYFKHTMIEKNKKITEEELKEIKIKEAIPNKGDSF